ncbi:MsnO8 family LLM class oxidoreductase [Actinomadura gamaensis]|uniref:MsnO8 family LLM class oxidoreductase n=1 Tax=Actinomadura gamaensis TaxID=1763541 RepID=A0ABV9TY75_9ACTN
MELSILDQSPIPDGSSAARALTDSIDLARAADRLGYRRYWAAEHHAARSHAGPAPEIVVAAAAAATTRIRVGSGGVLLPYYSPLKVAETFRVLHALYPDRIDLGLGRAIRAEAPEFEPLRRDASRLDFAEKLAELRAFLSPDHWEHPEVHVMPDDPGGPEVWLLGSSARSAEAAARLGLPYAYAHFLAPDQTKEALARYRQINPDGRIVLGLGVYCGETDAEARWLYAGQRLFRQRMSRGEVRPLPSPEQAVAELGEAGALDPGPDSEERYVVGTPGLVHERITALATEVGADEVTVLSSIHDHEERVRSYALLAEAFDLRIRASAA